MKEAFLHYIWQYQKFTKENLLTQKKEPIAVFNKGFHNTNAGPDFLEAKVMIGTIEWSGAVEIHVKASDWLKHKHQDDPAYEKVILHVVWEADTDIKHQKDTKVIPTLALKSRVNTLLLAQYEQIIQERSLIPCANFWSGVTEFTKQQMLESAIIERLSDKSEKAAYFLKATNNDWEEVTYFLLCSAFGFKINSQPFELLAQYLPYNLLRKYRTNLLAVEALLFGAAGFLEEEFEDEHRSQLKQQWQYLKHKHKLAHTLSRHDWKYLRLRPPNFPTVRLAELAQIIHQSDGFFSHFAKEVNVYELKKILSVKAQNYWRTTTQSKSPTIYKLGKASIDSLILNSVPPLLALYAKSIDEQRYIDKAITILESLKPENNKVTRLFEALGENPGNAFESQAYLQLHNRYCVQKRCLECKIGISIMSKV